MLIALYLSIVEEDGAMSIVSLRQLAKAIGVQNPECLNLKVDLIRAIQDKSRTHPCFQLDPSDLCNEIAGCQWKAECRKIIAEWGILHFSVCTFCNYRFDKARKAKPYPWINESEKTSVHCTLKVFIHVISKFSRFPIST